MESRAGLANPRVTHKLIDMRIAVDPVDEVHSRAAATLVSSPLVDMVGLVGKRPPRSWGSRAMRIENPAGFERCVGPKGDHALTVGPDGSRSVSYAGLTGLARALSTRLAGPVRSMDRTVTSHDPGEGPFAVFPAPLGAVRRSTMTEGVMLCPTPGTLCGVSVTDDVRQIAMVDDVIFASGVCLAAGALLDGPGPVWERAEAYLELVESMGLVFAEADVVSAN